VPGGRLELPWVAPNDFESFAYTNSAIPASDFYSTLIYDKIQTMSNIYSNSIFWIDTDKIKPNPYQPRRDFDEVRLRDLSDSIKQYGVLQPLTVSRLEVEKEGGGLVTEYELIAGERRLRAAMLANVSQVPVIIRTGDTSMMKLELAIIENLQREDLNAVDRARAFFRLASEFKFTHIEIAKKMGKSREYVSNSLRILNLPEEILTALSEGKLTDGHTRPLLMLVDHPEEQMVLFKEIVYRKITVREAEKLARKIAYDRIRKKEFMPDPEIIELEEEFQEKLGTRVHIDRRELGGQIKIDFFSNEDLREILNLINKSNNIISTENIPVQAGMLEKHIANEETKTSSIIENESIPEVAEDDRSKDEIDQDDTDLYNISKFSV
jgi:ParB family chromosome partitioning protein